MLYETPATPFVAEFFGSSNVLRGRAVCGTAVLGHGLHLPTVTGGPDGPVSVYVRRHDLDVARELIGDSSWPAP